MAKNTIVKTWDQIPPWGKFAFIGVAGFLVFRGVQKATEKIATRKRLKLYQASNVPVTITTGGGPGQGPAQGVVQNLDLSTIASEIYDSFHNNDPFGWTEDETRAVNSIGAVPRAYMPQLSDIYFKLYAKSLKEDFINALDSDEWAKVKYLFS